MQKESSLLTERLHNLGLRGVGVVLQQAVHGRDHPGRAEAALRSIVVRQPDKRLRAKIRRKRNQQDPPLLHGMQVAHLSDALHGSHLHPVARQQRPNARVDRHRDGGAAARVFVGERHHAHAAAALAAVVLGPLERRLRANVLVERKVRLRIRHRVRLAVDAEDNRVCGSHDGTWGRERSQKETKKAQSASTAPKRFAVPCGVRCGSYPPLLLRLWCTPDTKKRALCRKVPSLGCTCAKDGEGAICAGAQLTVFLFSRRAASVASSFSRRKESLW